MNLNVRDVPFVELAKRNLMDLATIEREIFGLEFSHGTAVAKQPKYWDIGPDGRAPTFLRFPAIG